jgi:hypothetical protein
VLMSRAKLTSGNGGVNAGTRRKGGANANGKCVKRFPQGLKPLVFWSFMSEPFGMRLRVN